MFMNLLLLLLQHREKVLVTDSLIPRPLGGAWGRGYVIDTITTQHTYSILCGIILRERFPKVTMSCGVW